jgi:hypothetical protein
MNDVDVYTGWHWVSDDRTLRDGTSLEIGKTYYVPNPMMCARGLHWSSEPLDALKYASGAVCCRIEAWGETYHAEDKSVSEYRRVLQVVDAANILHDFACRCAAHALRKSGVTDARSWDAIAAKRAWLRGQCSDEDLATARDTARDAAWCTTMVATTPSARDAAKAAAMATAQDDAVAAARDSAMVAAKAAAVATARYAARYAAWCTTLSAARYATRDAAGDVTWDAENRLLRIMLRKEFCR